MRRSAAVPALLGLIAVALVGVLAFALLRTPPSDVNEERLDAQIMAGIPVPAPEAGRRLQVLDGAAETTLSQYRGQVVVLNFWGSWCDPCRKEAPLLERYHRRLRGAGVGTVLGVTYLDTPSASAEFERSYGLTYTSLRDPGSRFAEAYGARQMPETFVIDKRGRINAIARTAITREFMDDALLRAGVPKAVVVGNAEQ